ncbi:hypothetical protein [Ornithinibacillus halotolerans]|uniref:WYL domain-containing protein n=1 Tax=Ornithinibacillus halotolerans TaxID=1274357 RepID=A0A916RY10_9BACI|nr:hypothetical protein [Ornithinibacillus halotolerans]GGA72366.1 hypothetical protein GCM10008025_15200 [Ornithinibacillus halotolerans]
MNGLFLRSKENKIPIVIYYIDSQNNITQRTIRVVNIHDNFITAYCYLRKKVRTFKYENILSADTVRKRVGA